MSNMLLITKLISKTLKLINNSKGNQKTKTKEPYSFWELILFGVSQGWFYYLYFNIFLSDLFPILNDIVEFASYFDGNTLHNVGVVVQTSRMSAEKLFKWFEDN